MESRSAKLIAAPCALALSPCPRTRSRALVFSGVPWLALLLALGCGAPGESEGSLSLEQVEQGLTSPGLGIEFALFSEWQSGYCATFTLTNTTQSPLAWRVDVDLNDATLSNGWNGTFTSSSEGISVTPAAWAPTLAAGAVKDFGYCANKTGPNWAPEVIGGTAPPPPEDGLSWPIACVPGADCTITNFPDPDGNGIAYDCSSIGIPGHDGTDIAVSWAQMDAGVDVLAAADGTVVFVSDGKYDRCPNVSEPDCQDPVGAILPGGSEGHTVCTDDTGPYCNDGSTGCYWCFAGGNVVIIQHDNLPNVFATRYDHFKMNSITVRLGDSVSEGQKIGEVGSAGNSTGPHLHFETWGQHWYDIVDPFLSENGCGTNDTQSLWRQQPPW